MSEQQKILEMIEKGQITAAEAMELLEALKGTSNEEEVIVTGIAPINNSKYKFLKVKVTSTNGKLNVNVNVPIRLLTTIGELSNKMTTIIPEEARKEMEVKGIDLSNIDFAKIIDDILNGTLDDPTIVDVEVADPNYDLIKVKIYVE